MPFYNVLLAIAGALANKKRLATTAGTLSTHGPLFVVLLLGMRVLVGALTYVPALARALWSSI
jgi:potassium-transporting ATPase potassium-binding subunit